MSTAARRTATLLILLAAALAVLATTPRPALASCISPPPLDEAIAQAPMVFVGTVEAVEHGGGVATFAVEEVWVGDDLTRVTVHGAQEPGAVTSIDRTFMAGERYLVFPMPEGSVLKDNSCTSTQVWSEELAAFRPADARTVDAGAAPGDAEESSTGGAPWALVGALAALVVVGGATGIVLRRR